MASYGRHVSVSARLDQLMNESFVADLGYPADPSMVARVVRGLQLLADEIDAIDAHVKDAHVEEHTSRGPSFIGGTRATRPGRIDGARRPPLTDRTGVTIPCRAVVVAIVVPIFVTV